MKRPLTFVLALTSITAFGLPIAYEGFDYSLTPTNLVGHTNPDGLTWYQAGPATPGTNVPSINAGSLTYSGLAPSTGNSAKLGGIDGTGMAARFSRASGSLATSGTIYYSFLVKLTDITGLTAAGNFFAGFNNSSGSQAGLPSIVAARVVTRSAGGITNATQFQIGVDKNSSGAAGFTWDPNFFNVGDTLFIVGSYTFNTGSTSDDEVRMWVNPSSTDFGAAAPPWVNGLTNTSGNDIGSAQINSFCLFNRRADQPLGIVADELTIGSTWADVTPTAASMAIVTQPKDVRIVAGNRAAFSVATYRATTYQWQHNGVDIPGATTTSLTLSNAQLSDAGSYHVVVGNGVATPLTSSNAVLTVKADTFPRLAPLWSIAPFERPYMTTDPSQTPMQRYFAYNALSNQVLIVSRTNTTTLASTGMVYVLNASTGADLYQMNADSAIISGGLNGIALSSVDVADDGAVYGANISDATTAVGFRLYRWANSDASTAPVTLYDGDPFGLGFTRYGDSLAVRGSGVDTDVLLDDSRGLYGAIMQPTDSSMTAFMPSPFTNVIGGLTGGRTVLFADTNAYGTNAFWEKHRGGALNLASYDLAGFTSAIITNYSNFPITLGVCGFNFSLNLLCGINFLDDTNASDTLDLFDISDPSLPVFVASYNFPTNSQANANRCGRVIFAGNRVFALDANNGFLAFTVVPRLTITPTTGEVVLSWPTNFTGYTLTATPALSPTPTWTNVSSGTIEGTQYVVTNTPSAASLFYRLKR
jgi:hypothetical protein